MWHESVEHADCSTVDTEIKLFQYSTWVCNLNLISAEVSNRVAQRYLIRLSTSLTVLSTAGRLT